MKQNGELLAVLGGPPSFAEPLHVGRPNVPDVDNVLGRVRQALERAWLTNDGPLVRELEQKLARYLGVPHCVAMSNGTAAMEVVARALNLTGEVIVPAFTFIATPHAFAWLGLEPVFCDIDPETHTIDAQAAEQLISSRTSAIVGVHLWGRACNVTALQQLADRHHIALIYDAAHAMGASFGKQRVGNFGTAEVFSFHATKFFNTFEGGAVTTKDAALAARLRLLRNFGFAGYDEIVALGTNAKLSEAHAAMGLALVEHLDKLIDRNAHAWVRYAESLRGLNGCKLMQVQDGYGSNYQYVVVELDDDFPLTRDQLLQVLWQENVRARRYFFPGCHRVQPYVSRRQPSLPVTEVVTDRVLVLPAGATISDDEIDGVVQLIRLACDQATVLRERLPATVPSGGFKA
jgi:dTDP-4-amino-4,6-dideoxygalactose transaminase